jgi:hypothetical protein
MGGEQAPEFRSQGWYLGELTKIKATVSIVIKKYGTDQEEKNITIQRN